MMNVPAPTVHVLNVEPVQDRGNLRAFATIRIGPLEILKCRLIQQDGQKAYVAPPQESWQDKQTGRWRYYPLLKWPPEWAEAITIAVQAAYQK